LYVNETREVNFSGFFYEILCVYVETKMGSFIFLGVSINMLIQEVKNCIWFHVFA